MEEESVRSPLLPAQGRGKGFFISPDLPGRFWIESKATWKIAGAAIFSRLAIYGFNVITQAFVGHLGNLELAAFSMVISIIVGITSGIIIGMGTALGTLCGQAYGAQRQEILGIYMQRSWIVLSSCTVALTPFYFFATPILKLLGQPNDIAELSDAWTGYSMEAFVDIWPFLKLSVASGVMVWLELWYYRLLVLLTGNIKDVEVAIDSLSICLNINTWEMAIPLGLLASTSVRVANELGARRPRGAKFAVIVSVITSIVIGITLLALIFALRNNIAQVFTDSVIIQKAVHKLVILLAFTILLNSIQPVLLGVAVGLGWQAFVAYINIGCYYIIGVPLGMILGYVFHLGVMGIWLGMIFGTGVQTLALMFITWRADWDMEAKTIESKLSQWSSVKPQNEKNKQRRSKRRCKEGSPEA